MNLLYKKKNYTWKFLGTFPVNEEFKHFPGKHFWPIGVNIQASKSVKYFSYDVASG